MTQQEALSVLKSGKSVFLTGEPGSGKTYTVNKFIEYMKATYKPYAVTASTGIAATHINGQTIHSWSGLRIERVVTKFLIDKLRTNFYARERIQRADVLIIDEVSMLDAVMIDNLDLVLRGVNLIDEPFGGIQMVFVGDFFQLPPVLPGEVKPLFAFEAKAWKDANLTICYLTEQHRQSDPVFLDILGAMRRGTIGADHKKILADRMNVHEGFKGTHLYTHNADVDLENMQELAKLPEPSYTYKMQCDGTPYLIELMKKNCLSPDLLVLKKGAVVMFTRNKTEEGIMLWVNGTIGTVIDFDHGKPVIETVDGEIHMPEPERWEFEENGVVKARIMQIPLRLAWAMTVHKSQGMSLDAALMNLGAAFEYGQGYVAISRVRSLSGLYLEAINDTAFAMHPKVIEQDKLFRNAELREA